MFLPCGATELLQEIRLASMLECFLHIDRKVDELTVGLNMCGVEYSVAHHFAADFQRLSLRAHKAECKLILSA